MPQTTFFSLLILGMLPSLGSTLEIKNIRLTHGPDGVVRNGNEFLSGDAIFLSFDIDGLELPKGKAKYETIVELYNMDGKKVFANRPGSVEQARTPIAASAAVVLNGGLFPGNYVVRVIVVDKLGNDKFKHFDHKVKIVPEAFGIVNVRAPAVGFAKRQYAVGLNVTKSEVGKNGAEVDVVLRLLDESGTKEIVKQVRTLTDPTFVVDLPQVGRFIVDIEANDKIASKKAKLRYPLTVVDGSGSR